MPYIGYERIIATNVVKDASELTIPAQTTHVEIQAESSNVRYTMDGSTDPTVDSGMLFLSISEPKLFLVEDVKKIRFIRDSMSNAALNFHYFVGRIVS